MQNPALIKINQVIDSFTDLMGKTIAWLTFFMALVTVTVLILRYGFDIGSIALQESVKYMHAFVIAFGTAYTLKYNEHVRVDIFYNKFSQQKKAWVDIFGNLFLLQPVCILIIWASWPDVIKSWEILEASREAGGIPALFIVKTLLLVLPITLSLQGIAELIKNFITIIQANNKKIYD